MNARVSRKVGGWRVWRGQYGGISAMPDEWGGAGGFVATRCVGNTVYAFVFGAVPARVRLAMAEMAHNTGYKVISDIHEWVALPPASPAAYRGQEGAAQ